MVERNGYSFDSEEEYFFWAYCKELEERGFIEFFYKNNDSIVLTEPLLIKYKQSISLKTKIKEIEKEQKILSSSSYTPDFNIDWNPKSEKIFYQLLGLPERVVCPFLAQQDENGIYSVVECKPVFDRNNMTRLFKHNQKFIWDKFKIFVNLVYPIDLFKKTFTPEAYFTTLAGRKRNFTYPPTKIDDYIKTLAL